MSNTLIINSGNISNTLTNSTFTYRLIAGNFKIPTGARMCVSSVQIPYSIFNITKVYNNYKYEFKWTIGGVINSYDIDMPDGFYSVTDLQLFLELFCINNGLYLIDGSGNNVYYFVMSYNPTYYAVQFLFFLVPTSLPATFTQPANFAGYPTVSTTPGIEFVNNNFNIIVGFNIATYGNALAPLSINSTRTPIGSPVNSLIIRCNIVDNAISNQPDILDSFSIGQTTFGTNIDYTPSFQKFVKIKGGTYSDFLFTIVDQDFNIVYLKDPNILISILLDFEKVERLK